MTRFTPGERRTGNTWYCVAAGIGAQRQTVYWCLSLRDGRRLTVGRVYVDKRPTNQWHWRVYDFRGKALEQVIDSGPCLNVNNGRRLAEEAAGLRRAQ